MQFLPHNLVGFAPGDFLVINERMAYASADDPQEIPGSYSLEVIAKVKRTGKRG